jgi:F-type H+-transporting ATPase subunit epsilon
MLEFSQLEFQISYAKNFETVSADKGEFAYKIKSGVIEFNNDNGIILCEC